MRQNKGKYWSKLIAEQKASGQKARPFCRERGIGENSFCKWCRRLRQSNTVQFALLEVPAATAVPDSALELVLRNGERLPGEGDRDAGSELPASGRLPDSFGLASEPLRVCFEE